MTERSELDDFAIATETAVDRFIGDQNASKNFVLVRFATDDSVGTYPQAVSDSKNDYFEDDDETYYDKFPEPQQEGPMQLKLARGAKWTDVMSSILWSEGFLVSEDALATFKEFDLGNARIYPAIVRKGRETRDYHYIFIANHFSLDDVDFSKSEFYLANMLGEPIRMIECNSAKEFMDKRKSAFMGTFENCKRYSIVACKRIQLKKVPKAAIFGTRHLNSDMYISSELHNALRTASVTGLQFKRNNMLFN